jgi:hypothetical protein
MLDAKKATLLFGRREIMRELVGVTLSGEVTRKAPVRAQSHPTQSFALPAPRSSRTPTEEVNNTKNKRTFRLRVKLK